MKRFLATVFLIPLMACSAGCAHIPTPIKDFGSCLNNELGPQIAGIIADVESALASANYFALLTSLGRRVGFAVVDCAVLEVGQNSRARYMAAPGDRLSAVKADHADAWMSR